MKNLFKNFSILIFVFFLNSGGIAVSSSTSSMAVIGINDIILPESVFVNLNGEIVPVLSPATSLKDIDGLPVLNVMGEELNRSLPVAFSGIRANIPPRFPNINFRQWKSANATMTISVPDSKGISTITINAKNLLPGGYYTVWRVYQFGPNPLTDRFSFGPLGGLPNVFSADELGNAQFIRKVPISQFTEGGDITAAINDRAATGQTTLKATDRFAVILGYHSNQQSNANVDGDILIGGDFGVDMHIILSNDGFPLLTNPNEARTDVLDIHPLNGIFFNNNGVITEVGDGSGNNTSGAPANALLLNRDGKPLNRALDAVFGPMRVPFVSNSRVPPITLADWQSTSATLSVLPVGKGKSLVQVNATDLPAEGLHMVWMTYVDKDNRAIAFQPLGGLPNVILPNETGNGTLSRPVDSAIFTAGTDISNGSKIGNTLLKFTDRDTLLSTDRIIIMISYHSNQQTNGNVAPGSPIGLPGKRTLDFHPQIHNASGFQVFPRGN